MKMSNMLLLLALCVPVVRGADVLPMVPGVLDKCAQKLNSDGKMIEFNTWVNPFYLRGDFDGDGRADYVAQINPPSSDTQAGPDSSGLLFCFASGSVHAMGAGLGALPEDADPDLFISPYWQASPGDADDVRFLNANGEVVVMSWEGGGASVIYRDQTAYKFAWIEPPP